MRGKNKSSLVSKNLCVEVVRPGPLTENPQSRKSAKRPAPLRTGAIPTFDISFDDIVL